ncbi:transcriptional regulator [Streptomyces sp. NRRL S-455]|uniref:transcriptional regulator n=1 Tax=Streptomyces sp. NRRL S-455 TaxID=1463908 RepID=UPI0004C1CAB3|nr:transcriptional regulator [Streptomyces sp. NRRL S-455]
MNEPADETAEGDTSRPADSAASAEELAALLRELHALQQGMPPAVRDKFADLLDPHRLSYDTGIEPAERVTALLNGARPADDQDSDRWLKRLVFLRNTRTKTRMRRSRGPRPYFLSEIARGVEKQGGTISKATLSYIFNEGRRPTPENLAYIERFFGVLPGFCSYTESEALVARLRPIVQQLRILTKVADAAAHGVTKVAARTTEDLSRNPDAMTDILTALLDAGVLNTDPDGRRRTGD